MTHSPCLRVVVKYYLPVGAYKSSLPLRCFVFSHKGVAILEKDDGSEDFEGRHTFIIRGGNDGRTMESTGKQQSTLSLESASLPGSFLTSTTPGKDSVTVGNFRVPNGGDDQVLKTASSFWFQPPLGVYPEGAMVLRSQPNSVAEDFVVAPFFTLVEERYTIYFQFLGL